MVFLSDIVPFVSLMAVNNTEVIASLSVKHGLLSGGTFLSDSW